MTITSRQLRAFLDSLTPDHRDWLDGKSLSSVTTVISLYEAIKNELTPDQFISQLIDLEQDRPLSGR